MSEQAEVVNEVNAPGTDRYNEQMIAKAESGLTGSFNTDINDVDSEVEVQEEKLYAGKFKSESDLEKSVLELLKKQGNLEEYYKQLESNLGKKKDDVQVEDKPEVEQKEEVKVDANAPLDNTFFEGMTKEFWEKGDISSDSISKLTALGIPQSVIEIHKKGLIALQREQVGLQEKTDSEIESIAGGKEGFSTLMDWAKDNVPNAFLKNLSDAYTSNDTETVSFNLKALKKMYAEQNGVEPQLKQGSSSNSSSGDVYASWAEVTKDMSDKRYAKDSSFNKMVQLKLKRSKI